MTRIRSYGPSLVLVAMMAAVLVGGPYVVRDIAHAQQEADLAQVRENLSNGPLGELSRAFRDVGRAVEPSVVHISVSHDASPDGIPERFREFFERQLPPGGRGEEQQQQPEDVPDYYRPPQPMGNGSGWVYSDGEHIITNYHVVRDADEIEIRFFDRTTATAEVVGFDEPTDIAVLRLTTEKELHPSRVAQEPVSRGDIVFAFGSPFGFEFSMSQGIVSGKGRELGILARRGGYEDFIQTDAAINRGNSGGPLTNYHGEVVGMNTAIATETGGSMGLGFAIPADMLSYVVDQLVQEGEVTRGFLGIMLGSDDPAMLRTYGYDGRGVPIDDFASEESPAREAGLEVDDIITAVDDRPVRSATELRHRIAMIQPGETIDVTVFRDGETLTVPVTLSTHPGAAAFGQQSRPTPQQPEEPDEPDAVETLQELGIDEVETFREQQAERLGMPFEPGVLIESVQPGSIAATARLAPGMVIVEVMSEPVTSVSELAEELAKHDLSEGVRIRVMLGEGIKRSVVLILPDG